MAGSATLYLEKAVLSHTLAYGPLAAPANVYISLALSATVPSATTPGAEVTGPGYVRQLAPFVASGTVANVAENSATIEYPPAGTPGWGTVGYFEIWDAQTAGNRLYWGPLVDPTDGVTPITRNVLTGDILRFSAGVIQLQAT